MNLDYLQQVADYRVGLWWTKFRKVYPQIQEQTPKAVINKRLKTTAGRAFIEDKPQSIDLCADLFWQYTEKFVVDIIPHELAHLVAFTVYGDLGHGTGWKRVIREFNIPTTRLHQMVNKNKRG